MQEVLNDNSSVGVAPNLPNQLQQQQQQQQQQTTRGRGRGRGTRGRGGQSNQPTQNPSVPHIVTRLVAGTQPIVKPENSYYIINLVHIVSLFENFAIFITGLARRGDWPLGAGYYQGLMLYALAAKLQRVGIASNQIHPNSSHTIQVTGFELPTSIVTLIDQFGTKMSPNGVMIAPLVTDNLVATLSRLAFSAANINCDHSANNPNHGLYINANRFNLMSQAYGHIIFYRLCIANVAARLGTSCSIGGQRYNDLNRTLYQMAFEQTITTNQAVISNADMILIMNNGVNAAGLLLVPFTVGGPLLVAGGTINAGLVAACNEVRAAFSNAANIFQQNDLYVDGSSVTVPPGGWGAYYTEQVELAHRFYMSPVSVSPAGSFAPTVVTGGDNQMSGYSVVAGLTAMEWNLGLVLGADSTFVTRDGIPFNVSDRARRSARYSVPPIDMSYDNLTSAFIRESMRVARV